MGIPWSRRRFGELVSHCDVEGCIRGALECGYTGGMQFSQGGLKGYEKRLRKNKWKKCVPKGVLKNGDKKRLWKCF